jgi:hypothetical protein
VDIVERVERGPPHKRWIIGSKKTKYGTYTTQRRSRIALSGRKLSFHLAHVQILNPNWRIRKGLDLCKSIRD